MNTLEFKATGMSCPACVALLTEEFSKLPGVKKARVELAGGRVRIEYEGETPPLSLFEAKAREFGYGAEELAEGKEGGKAGAGKSAAPKASPGGRQAGGKFDWRGYAAAIAIAAGILLVFSLIQGSPMMRMLGQASAVDQVGGAGIALLIGVAASFSSCLALVGSIVVAFSANYSVESGGKGSVTAFRSNLLFHAGRLGAFFLLGGLLGELGGAFSVSFLLVGIIGVVAALAMALSGLGLLGFSAIAAKLGLRAPRFATAAAAKLKTSKNPAAPLVLGALTFFLPCGFTQGMQAFALASGSFMQGGLAMLFFGLGTLPILFAAGMTAHLARKKGMLPLTRAAGLLLIVFAFVFGNNAFAQIAMPGAIGLGPEAAASTIATTGGAGSQSSPAGDGSSSADGLTAGPGAAPPEAKEQVVEMRVLYSGYSPDLIKVKRGVPVVWKIYGDEITGCTNAIVIPALKIQKKLSRGLTEIRFTPDKAGRLDFSCWMGMVWGAFQVEG